MSEKKIVYPGQSKKFYTKIPQLRDFFLNYLLKDGWYVTNLGQTRFIEYTWILNNLKRSEGRILDVGFGKFPVFPLQLAALGYDVYGIDLVDEMQPIFKKISETLNFKITIGDVRKAYQTGFFDIITCVSTVEHSEDDLGIMQKLKQLLTRSGLLFLTTEYGRRKQSIPIYDYATKKGEGWKVYDKESFAELIKGFRIRKTDYFIPKNKTWVKTTEEECGKAEEGLVCAVLMK
jgi:SAM-dependent methyltransferase